MGKIAAGFLAANAISAGVSTITSFIGGSVDAAKDLGESLNAVNVVFEGSSAKVTDWGKANANAFGLSNREFNQLVTPLGAMLTNYGFSTDEAADKSIALTKRAADMASVFNVDVGEALGAIQAGLRGEADPLEKFGVGLNAAAVQSKALAMTGKDVASSLTDQEKKSASLALIMEQTDKVAGDFANTSGDLANSQRIAAAKTEELQARLGEKLLPVTLLVTQAKLKLTEVLVDTLIPAFQKLAIWVRENVIPVVKDLASTFREDVLPVIKDVGAFLIDDLIPVAKNLAQGALKQFLLPALITLKQGWDDLKPSLVTVAGFLNDNVVPVLKTVGQFLLDHKPLLIALAAAILLLLNPWLLVVAGLVVVLAKWDEIKVMFTETIPGAIDSVITKIEELPIIGEIFKGAFEAAKIVVETYLGFIKADVELAINSIRAIIQIVTALIHGDFGEAWSGIKDLVGGILDNIQAKVGLVLGAIKDLIWVQLQTWVGVISDGGTLMFNAGVALMGSLASGIKGGLNAAIGAIESGINTLLSGLGKALSVAKTIADAFPGPNPVGNAMQAAIEAAYTGITLPRLAHGGIVTRPTLAMIGEAGPEAVVPLSRGGVGGDTIINLTIYNTGPIEEQKLLRWIAEGIRPIWSRAAT